MNVKELIEKLQKIENQDAIISISSSNFELNYARIEATTIYNFKGEITDKSFRDAFDGTDYTTKTIQSSRDGKKEFIEIM